MVSICVVLEVRDQTHTSSSSIQGGSSLLDNALEWYSSNSEDGAGRKKARRANVVSSNRVRTNGLAGCDQMLEVRDCRRLRAMMALMCCLWMQWWYAASPGMWDARS